MPLFVDLTGKKFNRWTVLSLHPERIKNKIYWLCRCDCGTIRIVERQGLTSGTSKSCGCYAREVCSQKQRIKSDIVGQRFGTLLVLRRGLPRGINNSSTMICQCNCGSIKEYLATSLKSGNTKGCGCTKAEVIAKKNFRNSVRGLETGVFCLYRRTAEKKGLSFDLTRDGFVNLIYQDCHYCGRPPSNNVKKIKKKYCPPMELVYNGVDRVDNLKGYEIDNVVPCCRECNTMKHDSLSYDEMKAVAIFLKEYRRKKLEQSIRPA